MDQVFKALADPTRRLLLDRLFEQQGQTLGRLIDGLDMRRQSATRHLAILEDAGLVTVQWEGREKKHFLNPVPIAEIGDRWIDKFSRQRTEAILTLKKAVEENKHE